MFKCYCPDNGLQSSSVVITKGTNGGIYVSAVAGGGQAVISYIMEDIEFAKIKDKTVTLSYSKNSVVQPSTTFVAAGTGHVKVFETTLSE